MGDKPAPVALICYADRANEFRVRVTQKTKRIGVQRNVGPVLLAITGYSLQKFFPFVGRFNAHTENLDLLGHVSFRFINKGRHLGPAPGSPTATIEEDHLAGAFEKTFGSSTVSLLLSCKIAAGNLSPIANVDMSSLLGVQ